MKAKRKFALALSLLIAISAPASAGTKIQYAIKSKPMQLLETEDKSDLEIYRDQLEAWTEIIGSYQWSYADINRSIDREIALHIEQASDKVEEAYWIVALMKEKDRYYGDLPSEAEFYARQEAVYATGNAEALSDFAMEPDPLAGMSSRVLTANELAVAGDYEGGVYYSEVIDERYVLICLSHTMNVDSWGIHEKQQNFRELVKMYIENGHPYAVCVSDHHDGQWYVHGCDYDYTALRRRLEDALGLRERYPEYAQSYERENIDALMGENSDMGTLVGEGADIHTLAGERIEGGEMAGKTAAIVPSYKEIIDYIDDPPESAGDTSRVEMMDADCFTIENGVITHVKYRPEYVDDFIAVVMPDTGAAEIGEFAFSDINQNTDWTNSDVDASRIPVGHFYVSDGIERIGSNAFTNQNMFFLHLPDSVTTIGDGAISGCNNLMAFEVPPNVTKLNEGTFYRCTNLQYVIIPDNVTYIDDGFLLECNPNVIIYGWAGSAAQDYAKRMGLVFVDIGSGESKVPQATPEPNVTPLAPKPTLEVTVVPEAPNAKPEPVEAIEPEDIQAPEIAYTAVPDKAPQKEAGVKDAPTPVPAIPSPPSYKDLIQNRTAPPDLQPIMRIKETYPALYDELESEMADINGWKAYRKYIYHCIDQMEKDSLAYFMLMLSITDLHSGSPSSRMNDIFFDFEYLAQVAEEQALKQYREYYHREPTEDELEYAVYRELTDAFFHEFGHRSDYPAGALVYSMYANGWASSSDEEANECVYADSYNILYYKLMEHTDEQTARRITDSMIRVRNSGGELNETEMELKNAALAALKEACYEDYYNTYTIMDGFAASLNDHQDREKVAPRLHGDDYYNRGGAAAMEMYAHFASAKFRCDSEALETFAEMYPYTYEYFEQKWKDAIMEGPASMDYVMNVLDRAGEELLETINTLIH